MLAWHEVLANISDYRQMINLHTIQLQEVAVWGNLEDPSPSHPFWYILNLEASLHSVLFFSHLCGPSLAQQNEAFSYSEIIIQFLFLSLFIFHLNISRLCFPFIFLLSIFTKITIIIIIIVIYILFYFILSFHLFMNIFYRVITIFHVPGCFLNFLECSVFVYVIAWFVVILGIIQHERYFKIVMGNFGSR